MRPAKPGGAAANGWPEPGAAIRQATRWPSAITASAGSLGAQTGAANWQRV